jgi:hypothetical protein
MSSKVPKLPIKLGKDLIQRIKSTSNTERISLKLKEIDKIMQHNIKLLAYQGLFGDSK